MEEEVGVIPHATATEGRKGMTLALALISRILVMEKEMSAAAATCGKFLCSKDDDDSLVGLFCGK